MNKYLYGWKLYVNYGQGWEYECFYTSRKEMLVDKKLYQQEQSYPVKVSRGRENNPEYRVGDIL